MQYVADKITRNELTELIARTRHKIEHAEAWRDEDNKFVVQVPIDDLADLLRIAEESAA